MTREEFLNRLSTALGGMPAREKAEPLRFYGEMIADRMEGGMTEAEAVAAMGDPDEVAREIIIDLPLPKLIRIKCQRERRLRPWEIILLVLGSPLWLTVLAVLATLVLCLYATLWSVVVCLVAAVASLAGLAVGGMVIAVVTVAGSPASALLYLGVSLFSAGGALLLGYGSLKVIKPFGKISRWLMRGIKTLLVGKKEKTV